jgi:hypothetical protein
VEKKSLMYHKLSLFDTLCFQKSKWIGVKFSNKKLTFSRAYLNRNILFSGGVQWREANLIKKGNQMHKLDTVVGETILNKKIEHLTLCITP